MAVARPHGQRRAWQTLGEVVSHLGPRAQDDLQRVSGDPVFFSHSHDLLGSRFQILDADWKVCTQTSP
jgi:hypothetical protein